MDFFLVICLLFFLTNGSIALATSSSSSSIDGESMESTSIHAAATSTTTASTSSCSVDISGECSSSSSSSPSATIGNVLPVVLDDAGALKGVPVIDIGPLVFNAGNNNEWYTHQRMLDVAEQIGRASAEWGFFQIINHGVSEDLIATVRQTAQSFFDLPKEEKRKCKRGTADNPGRGYYDDELTKQTRDWKEGFDIGHIVDRSKPADDPVNRVMEGYNPWPEDVPDFQWSEEPAPHFRGVMVKYYDVMTELSLTLMRAIAISLRLPPAAFDEHFDGHTSFLRLNYYPLCDNPSDHLAVNRHSDAGGLTVLLQDDGKVQLQVNYKNTGQWVSVEPVKGAFTINIGDMMQVWSNSRLMAPEHRVLASNFHARMSLPFFFNPSYNSTVQPFPQLCSPEAPRKYAPISWGYFREQRMLGDTADYGTEHQITNYLV